MKYNRITRFIISIVTIVLFAAVCYFSLKSNQLNNELKETILIKNNELATIKDSLLLEFEKSEGLNRAFENAKERYETTLTDLKNEEYEFMYMGEFRYTYYCDERRNHICGGSGITASGKPTEVGWTAAADTSVIPMGSILYIEGIGFREVQDVGSGVNGQHVDILLNTHAECFKQPLANGGVWILIKKS